MEEADCYTPKTCSKCEETEGEALGHDWLDATCEEPETCDRCGETEGEALGHTEGEPVVELDMAALKSTETVACTVCGEQLSSETVTVDSFLTGSGFAFTPNQFSERIKVILSASSSYLAETRVTDEDSMGTIIYVGSTPVAVVTYHDVSNTFLKDPDSKDIGGMVVAFYTSDDTALAYTMMTLVMACDPSLDAAAAGEVVTGIIEANAWGYAHNDISYMALSYQGQIMMAISVEGAY